MPAQMYWRVSLSHSPFSPWPFSWLRNISSDCTVTHNPEMPEEEFPLSSECWRQHPSKPDSEPYCYLEKPEVYSHWQTLYNQQQEWEAQKMLRKMRDPPRCALPSLFPTPSSREKEEEGVG